MPKYVSLIVGEGGEQAGCDYTIGCNMRWNFFEAEDMDEALIKSALEYYDKNDKLCNDDLFGLCLSHDKITVIEIKEQKDVNIEEINNNFEENEKRKEERIKDEQERELLRKLKEKYPDI